MIYTQLPMNSISDNELNNVIYIFLKYTFKMENPSNSLIADIMGSVGNNRERGNIIQCTVRCVNVRFGREVLGGLTDMLKHMNFVFDEFFSLPYDLRNDLGEDREASEFITQN